MNFQERRALSRIFSFRLAAERLLGKRNAHFLRDCPDRLGECNVLDLLNKTEDISRNSAAKAVIELPRGVDRERWRLFFVEGAESRKVLCARFLQRDIVADNADNVRLLLQGLREIRGEGHCR